MDVPVGHIWKFDLDMEVLPKFWGHEKFFKSLNRPCHAQVSRDHWKSENNFIRRIQLE